MAKGVNFTGAKLYIESKYGAEVWGRIMKSLPAESAEIWGGMLLTGAWYPFKAFKEMIVALNRELKTAKDSELAAIYEKCADLSINKLYKIFFSFTNPSFAIKNYPKLWSMFFNAGKVEVAAAEKGRAVLKFILPEIFNDWLPPACLGYSKKAVEMAGGSNLAIQLINAKRISDDLWETVFELRWTEK